MDKDFKKESDEEPNEADRLAAILAGKGFIAKNWPGWWYILQKRDKEMGPTLKEQLQSQFDRNAARRKYGIKKTTPTKRDIQELLVRVEKLLKDKE